MSDSTYDPSTAAFRSLHHIQSLCEDDYQLGMCVAGNSDALVEYPKEEAENLHHSKFERSYWDKEASLSNKSK